jgi:hypothetical protein
VDVWRRRRAEPNRRGVELLGKKAGALDVVAEDAGSDRRTRQTADRI